MAKGIWIYFELGIRADYEGMYAWLDNHGAHECGENLAFIRYDFEEDFFEELKADILNHVDLSNKDRIYIVFRDEEKKLKGKFLHGKRSRAPWTGYGSIEQEDLVDEA